MKTINFELPLTPVPNPATYTIIEQLNKYDHFTCSTSNKELSRRLDYQKALHLIDDLQAGNRVVIRELTEPNNAREAIKEAEGGAN